MSNAGSILDLNSYKHGEIKLLSDKLCNIQNKIDRLYYLLLYKCLKCAP